MSQHSRQEVNWEFLLGSSKSTLQAYEQSRLNFATNLRNIARTNCRRCTARRSERILEIPNSIACRP